MQKTTNVHINHYNSILYLLIILQKSVVQHVYEHLALERTKTGDSIFVFWDQKCLNYGMNWETGFLAGLWNSSIIILLISLKVIL